MKQIETDTHESSRVRRSVSRNPSRNSGAVKSFSSYTPAFPCNYSPYACMHMIGHCSIWMYACMHACIVHTRGHCLLRPVVLARAVGTAVCSRPNVRNRGSASLSATPASHRECLAPTMLGERAGGGCSLACGRCAKRRNGGWSRGQQRLGRAAFASEPRPRTGGEAAAACRLLRPQPGSGVW